MELPSWACAVTDAIGRAIGMCRRNLGVYALKILEVRLLVMQRMPQSSIRTMVSVLDHRLWDIRYGRHLALRSDDGSKIAYGSEGEREQ